MSNELMRWWGTNTELPVHETMLLHSFYENPKFEALITVSACPVTTAMACHQSQQHIRYWNNHPELIQSHLYKHRVTAIHVHLLRKIRFAGKALSYLICELNSEFLIQTLNCFYINVVIENSWLLTACYHWHRGLVYETIIHILE